MNENQVVEDDQVTPPTNREESQFALDLNKLGLLSKSTCRWCSGKGFFVRQEGLGGGPIRGGEFIQFVSPCSCTVRKSN